MNSYNEVKTQVDMEKLLDSIAGFHDSMAKEFHISNRGWVNEDHSMAMSHQFDVQLLVQSQWEPYAIELVFCDVAELHISDCHEYWCASGHVKYIKSPTEKVEIEMKFDASLSIKSTKLYYRSRTDWLGKKSFLNHEVPSPDAVKAKIVEGAWRQCQHCFDSWEELPENVFSYCTGCGRLTEIIIEAEQPCVGDGEDHAASNT